MKLFSRIWLGSILLISFSIGSRAAEFVCTDPKDPTTCFPVEPPTQCPDLTVLAHNRTDQKLLGFADGAGSLGFSNFSLEPYDLKYVRLSAAPNVTTAKFGVIANIRMYGQRNVGITCTTDVPNVNGCPDPKAQATVIFFDTGNGLTCRMFTGVALPSYP